jgi:serine/threonine-protein kinase
MRETRFEPRSRLPGRLVSLLVWGAGVVTGLAVFTFVLMPLYVGKGNQTRVPSVIGTKLSVAQARLSSSGLRLRRHIKESRSDIPEGIVVDQRPAPGTLVKEGRGIVLSTSTGPVRVMVPVLMGEDLRRADIVLAQMGLRSGRIARAHSDMFDEGTVIATSPAAGRRVIKDSQVDILASLGKQPKAYVMPELKGKRLDEAERILEAAELHMVVRQVGGYSLERAVIEQLPFPGSYITTGDTVEVVLGEWND